MYCSLWFCSVQFTNNTTLFSRTWIHSEPSSRLSDAQPASWCAGLCSQPTNLDCSTNSSTRWAFLSHQKQLLLFTSFHCFHLFIHMRRSALLHYLQPTPPHTEVRWTPPLTNLFVWSTKAHHISWAGHASAHRLSGGGKHEVCGLNK